MHPRVKPGIVTIHLRGPSVSAIIYNLAMGLLMHNLINLCYTLRKLFLGAGGDMGKFIWLAIYFSVLTRMLMAAIISILFFQACLIFSDFLVLSSFLLQAKLIIKTNIINIIFFIIVSPPSNFYLYRLYNIPQNKDYD